MKLIFSRICSTIVLLTLLFISCATKNVKVETITLDKVSISLTEGESATLNATVHPDNASDKTLVWYSSDNAVATVNNGNVTAVKPGIAVIKVSTTDGLVTSSCTVTVSAKFIPVTAIILSANELTIMEGKSENLVATVEPENASNKTITWHSSDSKIASVTDGTVNGITPGEVTITVKNHDATIQATCKVIVKQKPFAKIGDYFYQDGSYSTEYEGTEDNKCIGIVFYVSLSGRNGKIVGLNIPEANWNNLGNDEGQLQFGISDEEMGAGMNSDDNGLENLKKLKEVSGWESKYPAAKWCVSNGDGWYLPAKKELRQLFAGMCGLQWVASDEKEGQINDWGDYTEMPSYSSYAEARDAFNNRFTIKEVNGKPIERGYFWGSTENTKLSEAWDMSTKYGYTNFNKKTKQLYVRCIKRF